jgi:hypothetical protein
MTYTLNNVFKHYKAGQIAGRGTRNRFAQVPAINIQAVMRVFAMSRRRCFVCSPEREGDGSYRDDCQDNLHAVYSAGYTAGAIESLTDAALQFALWEGEQHDIAATRDGEEFFSDLESGAATGDTSEEATTSVPGETSAARHVFPFAPRRTKSRSLNG